MKIIFQGSRCCKEALGPPKDSTEGVLECHGEEQELRKASSCCAKEEDVPCPKDNCYDQGTLWYSKKLPLVMHIFLLLLKREPQTLYVSLNKL